MGWVGWMAVALATTLATLAIEILGAPWGYEDEDGFHYGADPRLVDELRRLEDLKRIEQARRREWTELG